MSATLRSNIDSNRSKLNPIAGLGDEAYVINDFDVFAIQGHNVVQSKIYNWDTGVDARVEERAGRANCGPPPPDRVEDPTAPISHSGLLQV